MGTAWMVSVPTFSIRCQRH